VIALQLFEPMTEGGRFTVQSKPSAGKAFATGLLSEGRQGMARITGERGR
jgi:hypothetical protein